MSEFKKLSEVEQIETASDNATVLVEENGEIKRVPKKKVGGGGGIATAIIKSSDYEYAIEGAINPRGSITYECINMTFEEAYEIMSKGEPLSVFFMVSDGGDAANYYGTSYFAGVTMDEPCIVLIDKYGTLFWTANGVVPEEESGGK